MSRSPALTLLLGAAALSAPVLAQAPAKAGFLRGYTVMAGGLGSAPRGPGDMWSNTVDAHLGFVERARINLVAIELPHGLSERHPKSPDVARFVAELRRREVAVWLLYPHALAQTFDLPRQVGADGEPIDWNCCFDAPAVQDWLCDNGVRLAEAYQPDALVLFGTFHVGGACRCEGCRDAEFDSAASQERFFARLREAVRRVAEGTRIGSCDFWAGPTKATLRSVDIVCPVVPIFRPDHADEGQVRQKLAPLRSRLRSELVVPYVKLFLAGQTASSTGDLLAAVRACRERAGGFLLWGYNPGHAYRGQDYDHPAIEAGLAALAEVAGRR
jgi:hypothetical protein